MNYLTKAEACEYLRIGNTKLWKLTKAGKIAYYKIGSSIMYNPKDLDEYVASCRVERAKALITNPYETYRKRRKIG